MARPRHEPTDETRQIVFDMCVAGVNQDTIAKLIGITKPTLEKYYRPQIDDSLPIVLARVATSLVKNATDNMNVQAQIFFLKTRGGDAWIDKSKMELTGANGGPLQSVAPVINVHFGAPDAAGDLAE